MTDRPGSLWRRLVPKGSWLRQPLPQFLLAGVALFLIAPYISGHKVPPDQHIVVDDAVVNRLVTFYKAQMASDPDPVQRKAMIDNYIHEQILYREALRLGLDRDDEIIRRRLVQKMEFLNKGEGAEPNAQQLEAYYKAHQDKFREHPHVSFTHIYFSPDKGGLDKAEARAKDTLQILHSGCPVVEAIADGDPFPLQKQFADLGKLDAIQLFGNTQIIEALFSAPVGEWVGPVRSGYGWHLVQVTERSKAKVPPLDEIKDDVRNAYLEDAADKQTKANIAAIAKHYVVERRYTGAPKDTGAAQ